MKNRACLSPAKLLQEKSSNCFYNPPQSRLDDMSSPAPNGEDCYHISCFEELHGIVSVQVDDLKRVDTQGNVTVYAYTYGNDRAFRGTVDLVTKEPKTAVLVALPETISSWLGQTELNEGMGRWLRNNATRTSLSTVHEMIRKPGNMPAEDGGGYTVFISLQGLQRHVYDTMTAFDVTDLFERIKTHWAGDKVVLHIPKSFSFLCAGGFDIVTNLARELFKDAFQLVTHVAHTNLPRQLIAAEFGARTCIKRPATYKVAISPVQAIKTTFGNEQPLLRSSGELTCSVTGSFKIEILPCHNEHITVSVTLEDKLVTTYTTSFRAELPEAIETLIRILPEIPASLAHLFGLTPVLRPNLIQPQPATPYSVRFEEDSSSSSVGIFAPGLLRAKSGK